MAKNTKPIIIAAANEKGGVGKTTTAINVAVALGLKGYKVLMIDLDPQESLSNFFGIYGVDTENNIGKLFYNNINEQSYDISDYIIHNETNHIDIIPSEKENMNILENDILKGDNGKLILKNIISDNKSVLNAYDFIVIDCPASLGHFTTNALCVAQYVIIPCQAEPSAYATIPNLYHTIADAKAMHNKKLSVLGIVATMNGNSRICKLTVDMLSKTYKKTFFKTIISKQSVVAESALKEKAVVLSNSKDNKAAQQYRTLVDEILERLG